MDTSHLLDWLNLLLRWAHVITGVAWIGASFYFVALDNSLTPPADGKDRDKGIGGELWAVHGGGFYHQQKYPVSPRTLPERLHWSMWESYSTWLTGFALFTVLYLFNAQTFLIDATVYGREHLGSTSSLAEAALTAGDAARYLDAYRSAIEAIGASARGGTGSRYKRRRRPAGLPGLPKGRSPVARWYSITPSANRSLRASTGAPRKARTPASSTKPPSTSR